MPSPPRIALLIETSSSWGQGLVEGIARYSQEHNPWLLFVEPRGKYEQLSLPRSWQGQGIIARVTSAALAEEIVELGLPAVNVSWYRHGEGKIHRCTSDETRAGQLAAAHFLDRGFRHFAYCGLPLPSRGSDAFGDAFSKALQQAGYRCQFVDISGVQESWWEQGIEVLADRLEPLEKPVGLLAFDDILGRQITEACQLRNIRVPDSVAVLGGEHDQLSSIISRPPLSGLDHSAEVIGYEAARLLDRIMSGEDSIEDPTLIPARGIITRQSTDTVAVDDEQVALAIEYIRAHYDQPIHVNHVLQKVLCSRRILEQKFQRILGRSPAAEIRRVRIEQAKKLLVDTEHLMPQIAARCGFENAQVFSRVFRREEGVSPSTFRKRFRV